MKKLPVLFLLMASLAFNACNNADTSNIATPQNPYANRIGRSIPNWATDTLVGVISHPPYYDTIYTTSQAGHSYISYHGTNYEVWDERLKSDAYTANAQVYNDGNIGYYMNDSTSITSCIVYPASYIDATGVTQVQRQKLVITLTAPFDLTTQGGVYQHAY